MFVLLQIDSTYSAAVLGSGCFVDDTITWTKGEVLGRGAYGTVCIKNTKLVKFFVTFCPVLYPLEVLLCRSVN